MLAIEENAVDMAAARRREAECAYMATTPRTSDGCGSDDCGSGRGLGSARSLGSGRGLGSARGSGKPARMHAEEVFHKNLVGVLNKRGYNVRDSVVLANESSETSTASITSTSSSMSSLILGLREPNHGQGPLHIAVRKGDLQVLDALLENECADEIVNLQDNNGNTALHFAAGSWRRPQCASMIARLLTTGADPCIKNKRGLTPLAVHMLTMKVDNAGVVTQLLEFGADPDTEVDGESLLHSAVRRELASICGTLVAFGASMTALNHDGLMCFEIAPQRIKRVMLRSIRKAPTFVPEGHRSKCMRCSAALRSPTKALSNFFKRLLGMRISSHACNCYHCGLLFCSQCLKHTEIADSLHVSFARSRMDDLASVKTCPFCDSVLTERQKKLQARQSLEGRNSRLFSKAA